MTDIEKIWAASWSPIFLSFCECTGGFVAQNRRKALCLVSKSLSIGKLWLDLLPFATLFLNTQQRGEQNDKINVHDAKDHINQSEDFDE
jgi:hypothetical protein